MSEEFIPCTVKALPDHLIIPAAKLSREINPANAPPDGAELIAAPKENDEDEPLPRIYRLALLTSKWWGASGVDLSVSFMDNPPASVRARILAHANAWNQSANVRFRETSGAGQVRIARTPGGGYWSFLGNDLLSIPANQPTMNLDSFSDATPESEYRRVVRHEVGHTLGFVHEHLRRQIVQRIDPAKAIAYFAAADGWDAQTVRDQVLTPLEDATLTATPDADVTSIMTYFLPGSITTDGQPIPGGLDIDASDFALAARLYPRSTTPTPTPTPPPVGPVPLLTLTFAQAVAKGRVVQFVAKVVIPAGSYGLTPLQPGHETHPHTSAFDV